MSKEKFVPEDMDPRRVEVSRRRFLRNAGVAAAAVPFLGTFAEVLSEPGASATTIRPDDTHPLFAPHPRYKFVMVNHVTTNDFFTATRYGIADACNLLKIPNALWTGSANSIVGEMVHAVDIAIAGKANGIGCCLIDNTAFDSPVDNALNHGIPFIAYNADVGPGYNNNRQAYIGQSNLTAGAAVARQILNSGKVKKGDLVAGIIATPGSLNIQPRINGAFPVLKAAGMHCVQVGTSATEGSPEYNAIKAWYAGHQDVNFMFGVDSGDSNAIAEFIFNERLESKVGGAGWDVGAPVLQAVKAGYLSFTIDQQAYLQGFVTIVQLFLYNISGGLMKPCDTDTGTGIVHKSTVAPYLAVLSRFEGDSSAEKVLKPPSKIPF